MLQHNYTAQKQEIETFSQNYIFDANARNYSNGR